MKNIKAKVAILVGFLIFMASVQPGVAANQYSVKTGANFRWDATKYYYLKDVTAYTHNYYLEFNFTNWAGVSGAEYLNGTVNNNGTIYDGEISHMYYYGGQNFGQEWVTEILDYQGSYPVYVYLVCNTEIEQTTKPNLQNLAANSWLTFNEPSTNNFTLTGTYIDGDDTAIYTGKVEFNSDKVLLHVYDELEQKTLGVTQIIERYEWTLTYTPGSGVEPNGETGGSIPGFPLYIVIAAIAIGFILIIRKNHIFNIKTN
jgi:hypothetical protein